MDLVSNQVLVFIVLAIGLMLGLYQMYINTK
jgi:hypothetical protein